MSGGQKMSICDICFHLSNAAKAAHNISAVYEKDAMNERTKHFDCRVEFHEEWLNQLHENPYR